MATTAIPPRNKVLSAMLNLLSYKKLEKNGNEKQAQQVSEVLVSVVLSMLLMHTVFTYNIVLLHLRCIIQVSSGVVVHHHDDSGSSYLVSSLVE
jgi:hypothetical protein